MKKYIFILLLFTVHFSFSQSITGKWTTYDDETNSKTSVVEIYQNGDKHYGKIIELFEDDPSSICKKCAGKKKNQPVIGLVIIENLIKDGDSYEGGEILDPENGKTYKCILSLKDTSTLTVRGFIGFSLFGRTQYWKRINH